jgi:hypothetical protein
MMSPSSVPEINELIVKLTREYSTLVDNDPRAIDIRNELSTLGLLRYALQKKRMDLSRGTRAQ